MKRIYLDWNATTPLDPRVLDAMMPYLRERFGNPSSLHQDGREARRAVEEARERIARAIGADPREIVFLSGATEANNLALRGIPRGTGPLLVSAIEHPSVLEAADALARSGGRVIQLPVNRAGCLDLPAFRSIVEESGAAFAAVMAVNNETGMVQPFEEVAAECARRSAPFHVDAVQALGKLAFSVATPGITSASFSAHKIGGPKGAGALFVRRETRLSRDQHGGGQERGRRPGTENVAAIVGLGLSVELACTELEDRRRRVWALESAFLDGLRARNVAFQIRGGESVGPRVPGVLSLGFSGFSGEGMLFGLDLLGVSVSLGSACSSGAAHPSHVLAAMGHSKQENLETVRFSMGPGLALDDVVRAADAVATVLRRGGGPGRTAC